MSRKTHRAKRQRRVSLLLTAKRDSHERRKKHKDTKTRQVISDTMIEGVEYSPHMLKPFRGRASERRKAHGKTLDYKMVVAVRRKAKEKKRQL